MEKNRSFSKIEKIKFGFNGIKYCLQKDKSVRSKCAITVIMIIASIITGVSQIEWFIVLTICGIMISLEMINTAVENTIDLIYPEYNEKAGIIKDTVAGAIQVMSYAAIIVGLAIFIPKLIN